jgi:hypothetical protein
MSEKRAFVIERTKHALDKVSQHGKLTYIFAPEKGRSSMWSNDFRKEIIKQLEQYEYDPAYDYIVLVGGFLITILFVTTVVSKYGPVAALAFDACDQHYKQIVIGSTNGHM